MVGVNCPMIMASMYAVSQCNTYMYIAKSVSLVFSCDIEISKHDLEYFGP